MKKWFLILTFSLPYIFEQPLYGNEKTVYVAQSGWHTGIVIKRGDLTPELMQVMGHVTSKTFIDFSWGDEKFYQVSGSPVGLALRAVLWPTSAVVRVFGFNVPVENYYSQSTLLKLQMDSKAFDKLCTFLAKSFHLNDDNEIIPSIVYRVSHTFFLAERKYHLFRTCNTWVALAFQQAGFDVQVGGIITANALFKQLEGLKEAEYLKKE